MNNKKTSRSTKAELQTKFNRAMNTPSPNPRYGGLTPNEVIQRSAKRKTKKSKLEDQEQGELQLST